MDGKCGKEQMKQINIFGIVLWASLTAVAQPTITIPPANQTVALGGTLTLGVTAGGTTLAYQWFKDSRLLVGATNNTLTVANAGVTNSGTYYVAVTNNDGMVISLPALVSVGNPSLLSWGWNFAGQLGNGTNSYANPTPIYVASNVVTGAAGAYYSLFVTANGTLWAMGENNHGQLGNGTTNNSNLPVSVASNVVAVAAGYEHSLFVMWDGTLWAMGYDKDGQLGIGANIGVTFPFSTPIKVASNVVAVAAGQYHSLFIKADGTLWAMGYNSFGELGNGTTSNATRPISIASNVVAVAAGSFHSLFVKVDGTLWAMGFNIYGQLGNGTTGSTSWPLNVANNVMAVAAGYNHSLFTKTDGTLWAMGWGISGQLGNGTQNNDSTPINVASNVVAVAAGYQHSLFTKADGTLWVMGDDTYGQLGIIITSIFNLSDLPVSVPNLTIANTFSADTANHSLTLGNDFLATVTLNNLNQLYTGSAISVTASTTPPGLAVNLTYNGSPNAPTNAGNYAVIGVISDPNYYGIATNTLVVGQSPQSFGVSSTNSQQLTLQLSGTPNYPYILESATNLTPPVVWLPVFTNYADTNGNWSFTITGLTNTPAGYYRAVAQ